jgi:hypothetical protein
VSREPAAPPPASIEDREPPESVAPFDAAVNDVTRLLRDLMSPIARLADTDRAHARDELEDGLSRAQGAIDNLSEAMERAQAGRRLQELRAAADLVLTIVPAPSSAAVEHAAVGAETTWDGQEEAWIVSRLSSGARSRSPQRRTYRRDTRPETPTALRAALREKSCDAGATEVAISGTALAPNASPDPRARKTGAR